MYLLRRLLLRPNLPPCAASALTLSWPLALVPCPLPPARHLARFPGGYVPGVVPLLSQGVSCPAIDFRQEQDTLLAPPGGATLSASFFLPRSANIVKLLSTMISADQVRAEVGTGRLTCQGGGLEIELCQVRAALIARC